jgi:hypothetical protein
MWRWGNQELGQCYMGRLGLKMNSVRFFQLTGNRTKLTEGIRFLRTEQGINFVGSGSFGSGSQFFGVGFRFFVPRARKKCEFKSGTRAAWWLSTGAKVAVGREGLEPLLPPVPPWQSHRSPPRKKRCENMEKKVDVEDA